MAADERPRVELLQGTLDLIVLRALATMGPQHAYGLAARLEQVSEHPLMLNQGTLYPALVRLEQRGWIKGAWQKTESHREARYDTSRRRACARSPTRPIAGVVWRASSTSCCSARPRIAIRGARCACAVRVASRCAIRGARCAMPPDRLHVRVGSRSPGRSNPAAVPPALRARLLLHHLGQLRLQRLQLRQVVVDDVRIGRVQLEEVLVVGLGRIERLQRHDRRHDRPREDLRVSQLLDVRRRDLLLLVVDVEDRRAILRAVVRPLPIQLRRVVRDGEEDLQQLAVGDPATGRR